MPITLNSSNYKYLLKISNMSFPVAVNNLGLLPSGRGKYTALVMGIGISFATPVAGCAGTE